MTFEQRQQVVKEFIEKDYERISSYGRRLEQYIADGNERGVQAMNANISASQRALKQHEKELHFMRENTPEDTKARLDVYHNFANQVNKVIPNGYPIVFHGTRYPHVVEEIIKSGGLLTPEQRGVPMESFANQIDVAYKSNIQTPIAFAETGADMFLPYGTVFAFKPLEKEEKEVVNMSKYSTQLSNGVEGVDFTKEPHRLVAIITTNENKEQYAQWCKQYNWPSDKVVTHDEFIEKCNQKFSANSIENNFANIKIQ